MFVLILIEILTFGISPVIGKTCELRTSMLLLNSLDWKTWEDAKRYCSGLGGKLPTNDRSISHCLNEWINDDESLNPLEVWKDKSDKRTECPVVRLAKYSKNYVVNYGTCTASRRVACAFRKVSTVPTTGTQGQTVSTRLRSDNTKITNTKRNHLSTTKSATTLPSTAKPIISVYSTAYISTATPENSVPTTSTILPANPSKILNPSAKPSAGVIAGAVLGTLFTIGCVCLAVFCLRRKCLTGQHSQEKDSATKQNGIRKSELLDDYVYDEAAGGSNQASQSRLSGKNNMPRDNVRNSSGDHKDAEIYNHLHEVDKTVNNSENVYNIAQGNAESEYSHISSTLKTSDVSFCEYSHIHSGSAGEDTYTYNHVHKGSAGVDTDTYSHVHKGSAGLDKDMYSYA